MSRICQLRPEPCRWCAQPVVFKELTDHEANCPQRGVACPAGCGEHIADKDMRQHLVSTCLNRFVPCELRCGLKVRQADMPSHTESACGNRLVVCPNDCFDNETKDTRRIISKRLDIHLSVECPRRLVSCGLCAVHVTACDVSSHQHTACTERTVACRIPGCLKQMTFVNREKHEMYQCKFRFVLCENGCGQRLPALLQKNHATKECDMRYVACPLQCGMSVRRRHLYAHLCDLCDKRSRINAATSTAHSSPGKPESKSKSRRSRQQQQQVAADGGGARDEGGGEDGMSVSSQGSLKSAAGRQTASQQQQSEYGLSLGGIHRSASQSSRDMSSRMLGGDDRERDGVGGTLPLELFAEGSSLFDRSVGSAGIAPGSPSRNLSSSQSNSSSRLRRAKSTRGDRSAAAMKAAAEEEAREPPRISAAMEAAIQELMKLVDVV